MSNGGVMLSGWLRKSPPERKLRKNAWKKRWFVLRSGRLSGDPNVLEYFRHQGSKKPIRAISLDECSQIDANVPVKYERKDPAQQFVFDIVTRSRTYYLVAESSLEMTSWVRYLCDLCGFTHDTAETEQHDLGSQQQTFKAVQPTRSPSHEQNGTAGLLEHEAEPISGEVPLPLPRPQNTITHRSTVIRRSTDANSNITSDEKSPLSANNASLSSTGSGSVSRAATPNAPRKIENTEKNGYSFAVEPPSQGSGSDYLLLADFKTANASDENNDSSLLTAKFCERRTSTDSVFTHEGAISEPDIDQPLNSPHLRFVTNMRKQRLDSMPDCPPPPPPVSVVNRPIINTTDERGYSFPPDDEDLVQDARKRSNVSSHSHGLSPIDDSDLNRVPLNLQREFLVDEMGNPLPAGHMTHYSTYNRSQTSISMGTEYINTTTAVSEAGFGNFPVSTQRYEYPMQQYPVPGRPFISPTHRDGQFVHGFMTSPLSDGSQRIHYDADQFPQMSSPRHHGYGSPLSKSSIHSSASALSPHHVRVSPQRLFEQKAVLAGGFPKIRRSSSVGQLESVANEISGHADRPTPTHARRCSIDNRGNFYSPQHLYQPSSTPIHNEPQFPKSTPPPRPPKGATVKQFQNLDSPVFDRKASSVNKSSFSTSRTQSSEGSDPGGKPLNEPEAPGSPAHAEVVGTIDLTQPSSVSPTHSTIIKTIPISPDAHGQVKNTEAPPRSVSSSSTNSTSASSRSRSPPHHDRSDGETPHMETPLYDTPGSKPADTPSNNTLYDTPTPQKVLYDTPTTNNQLYDTPVSKNSQDLAKLYDTPNNFKPDSNNNAPPVLAAIDDRASYEPMMDQSNMSLVYDASNYTCMAGATSLIHSPAFPQKSRSNTLEPPPVKRDLKPGRKSIGSDSGNSDGSRTIHSRSEDSFSVSSEVFPPTPMDPPTSPPHAMLMHSSPNTPVMGSRGHDTRGVDGRLAPPGRPPKHPSQGSLSPRSPPSATLPGHLPGRTFPTYGVDRTHKHSFDNQVHRSPSLSQQGPRRTTPTLVPGRPPKPLNMTSSPGINVWEEGGFSPRGYQVPQSVRSWKTAEFGGISSSMKAAPVPPPPESVERDVKYVELKGFPSSTSTTFNNDFSAGIPERHVTKPEEVVEYFVLDKAKTQALERTKLALEEQKRGSIDVRKTAK